MRAWIRVLDVPGCYEHVARVERKSTLQGLGLVRTVGPCAQRVMPRAIESVIYCTRYDLVTTHDV